MKIAELKVGEHFAFTGRLYRVLSDYRCNVDMIFVTQRLTGSVINTLDVDNGYRIREFAPNIDVEIRL